MTDEQLEQIKQAHPTLKLRLLSHPDGFEVVIRRPTAIEWKRFVSQAQDDSKRVDAGDVLVRTCVVFPGKPEFAQLMEEAPGFQTSLLKAVTEHAGATGDLEKKTL